MNRYRRLALVTVAALAIGALAGCTSASGTTDEGSQEKWPAAGTTIEWIVPSAAGAGNDILARIMAPVMQEELGGTIKVVNVEGGSQVVGLTQLATATPDGTSLGPTNIPSILGRYLDPSKNAPFDRDDFSAIGGFAVNSIVIAVGKDSPYDTAEELFSAIEESPGEITAGTDSRGGDDHINLNLLEDATDTELNIVHYNSGADKVAAVMSGEIDMALGGVSSFYGPYQSGDLKLLAVVDEEQSDLIPDVPTLESAGYEVAPMESRFVLSVPSATPDYIQDALEAALKKATEDPDVVEKLKGAATVTEWLSAEDAGELWDEREAEIEPIIDDLLGQQ
ncbi:Bug family tripartite tricarboxylate transporter substrate binding protein [Microbacterium sp. NPDC058342]|uniref:Bug family tripartite tricarboxylate transporter substrate binding protein n=1 Tax=Microbacterium sp. NPDC058342 TaxID=3346454 RepID=UPI003655B747